MKRFLKSCLSVLLAITIIIGSAYAGLSEVDFDSAFAVKAKAATTSDLTFKLNDDGLSYYVASCNNNASGKLVIPSTYNDKPVNRIGKSAFANCERISSITIPDSIKSIGADAFYGCWISSVHINDVANWCNIDFENYESSPFASEAHLYINGDLATNVVVPEGVTKIPYCAFAYESLETIVLPEGITIIEDGAFSCGYNLVSVNIPDSVTFIGDGAFRNCTSLVSISIPDGVTSIGEEVFMGCSNLETIILGNNITSIGGWAFCWCTSLEYIVLPNTVTSIGEAAFYQSAEEIICTKDSVAHKYAENNDLKYKLVSVMGKGTSRINYNDFIVVTHTQQSSNITDIISVSDSVSISLVASHKYDQFEFLGSGTTFNITDDKNISEDFMLVVLGDTNGDSVVDALDAAQVANASNGLKSLDGAYAMAADSNADDVVDIEDYQAIVNKVIA